MAQAVGDDRDIQLHRNRHQLVDLLAAQKLPFVHQQAAEGPGEGAHHYLYL